MLNSPGCRPKRGRNWLSYLGGDRSSNATRLLKCSQARIITRTRSIDIHCASNHNVRCACFECLLRSNFYFALSRVLLRVVGCLPLRAEFAIAGECEGRRRTTLNKIGHSHPPDVFRKAAARPGRTMTLIVRGLHFLGAHGRCTAFHRCPFHVVLVPERTPGVSPRGIDLRFREWRHTPNRPLLSAETT